MQWVSFNAGEAAGSDNVLNTQPAVVALPTTARCTRLFRDKQLEPGVRSFLWYCTHGVGWVDCVGWGQNNLKLEWDQFHSKNSRRTKRQLHLSASDSHGADDETPQ